MNANSSDFVEFVFFKHFRNKFMQLQCRMFVWSNSFPLYASHSWTDRQHESIKSFSFPLPVKYLSVNEACSAFIYVCCEGNKIDSQKRVPVNLKKRQILHNVVDFCYREVGSFNSESKTSDTIPLQRTDKIILTIEPISEKIVGRILKIHLAIEKIYILIR